MATLESRKIRLAQRILGEIKDPILSQIESLLNDSNEDLLVEKLTSRALKSEEDIKAGRVYTMDQARKEIDSRLSL